VNRARKGAVYCCEPTAPSFGNVEEQPDVEERPFRAALEAEI